jgi:hypothetical protein
MELSKELALKINRVRKEAGSLQKSSVNPFFNSSYIEINTLIEVMDPILEKENLMVLTPLDSAEDKPAIGTLCVDLDTGENFYTKSVITESKDAQKAGGAITYHRRYALISFFNLRQEDDDGNAASNSKPKAKAKKIGAKVAPKSNSRATF